MSRNTRLLFERTVFGTLVIIGAVFGTLMIYMFFDSPTFVVVDITKILDEQKTVMLSKFIDKPKLSQEDEHEITKLGEIVSNALEEVANGAIVLDARFVLNSNLPDKTQDVERKLNLDEETVRNAQDKLKKSYFHESRNPMR